jgi:competence protein ComGF
MKEKKDKLDQLFQKFDTDWDVQELENNHETRFLNKLKTRKSNNKYFWAMAVAASMALLFGISFFYHAESPRDLKFASKETKQTDSIFTVLIKSELDKIKEKKSPENEKIITDALKQMKAFDNDYEKIIDELQKNGESKQIIYAMISNLQTRISFLKNVLQQIEYNNERKNFSDEKTI